MYERTGLLFAKILKDITYVQQRTMQMTIIGACNQVGSKLALIFKQHPKMERLILYDEDNRVHGIALELRLLPGEPELYSYAGTRKLVKAVADSQIVAVVADKARRPGISSEQMLVVNAPAIQDVCKAIADANPQAFLAISTNPLNSIVPYACYILNSFQCYNPFKILGITQIDADRCKAYTGFTLKKSPRDINVPVIGGHSEDSIVPLFSNMSPPCDLTENQVDVITRLLKRAGAEEVVNQADGGCSTIAVAWSVNDFLNGLIEAALGNQTQLNCYTANPNFGSRYFSGPNVIGPDGIRESCAYSSFSMNSYESALVEEAVKAITRDVDQAEDYARIIA